MFDDVLPDSTKQVLGIHSETDDLWHMVRFDLVILLLGLLQMWAMKTTSSSSESSTTITEEDEDREDRALYVIMLLSSLRTEDSPLIVQTYFALGHDFNKSNKCVYILSYGKCGFDHDASVPSFVAYTYIGSETIYYQASQHRNTWLSLLWWWLTTALVL